MDVREPSAKYLTKPAYKQTEVGVMPEEWAVKPLGELFGFSGGYSASRDQLSTEGHCYLHYGDIHGSTKASVDTQVDFPDIPKLDIPLKRVSSRSMLKDGDIVFVDASEDDEGTSKHVVVVNKQNVPFISGLHTIVAKSKTDELVHEYRRYCFQTAAIREQFLFYAVGTKVVGISKSNIPKLFLPIPTVPEQRAIATALSDVDALLAGLDRLIAKKRDLKQAVMQQLLTGQTHLPGFSEEWEVKRFGDVLTICHGKSQRDVTAADGPYPILATGGQIGTASRAIYDQPSVLIGRKGTIDQPRYMGTPFWTVDTLFYSVMKNGNDAKFFYYRFCLIRWMQFNEASGVPSLNARTIEQIEFSCPEPTEQQAIATVLSDIDAELSALEARRDKTRALKRAMMQELLTGRIRLV